MLALLVLFSAFTVHSAPLAISARVASTMEAAMGDVLSSVGLPPPGCNAAPPLVCGGKDLIPNYDPQPYRSRHGQIFFGSGPFYISHLPLLYRPHNFQAIYEVDFPSTPEGQAAKAKYLDREDKGFASFAPGEAWSYPDFDCSIDQSQRTLAPGRLHQGQFEDGGEFVVESGLIVKRRIFFRIWPEGSLPPGEGNAQANGEYIVFGEGDQFFTARVVASAPDADHIQPVPAAMFRNQVGGAKHACYKVVQNAGDMSFSAKKCNDPTAPAPDLSAPAVSVPFNKFYVETEDISP
jgi:hypothetical protein